MTKRSSPVDRHDDGQMIMWPPIAATQPPVEVRGRWRLRSAAGAPAAGSSRGPPPRGHDTTTATRRATALSVTPSCVSSGIRFAAACVPALPSGRFEARDRPEAAERGGRTPCCSRPWLRACTRSWLRPCLRPFPRPCLRPARGQCRRTTRPPLGTIRHGDGGPAADACNGLAVLPGPGGS